jgi:hypothetical protein
MPGPEHEIVSALWQGSGLENGAGRAHVEGMVVNVLKLAALAGLLLVTSGLLPDWRKSAVLAIGTCIAGAFALHLVAP